MKRQVSWSAGSKDNASHEDHWPMSPNEKPVAFAVQPESARSYWQPVPANGFVEVHVSNENPTCTGFESGLQEVAPGGHVREHAHHPHEELILVIEGRGHAVINGETHVMQPGTTLYLAPDNKHMFVNDGDTPLRFFWVLMPGGISNFFEAIGRPRQSSDLPPPNFARPDDVDTLEASTVFVKHLE